MATYKSQPSDLELGALLHEASFYDVNGKKVKAQLHDNYLRLVPEKKLIASVQLKNTKDKGKDKSKDKSKDKDKVRYFPLALLYLDRRGDVTVKEKDKEKSDQGDAVAAAASRTQLPKAGELNIKGKLVAGFTLIGPEGSVVLGTSDKTLRKEFLDMLAREIKKSKKSLENDGYFTAIDLSQSRVSVTDLVTSKNEDIRKGKFVFAHGGWYEGEWFEGRPHGEGVYEKDEKRFEGWWNAHLSAGYGMYYCKDKTGSWRKQRGGWKVHLTESPGATYVEPEPELDAKSESGLLPSDIELILKHGEVKDYEPGETVLQEGQTNRNLYWIRAGSIAITKFDESTQKPKQIATLGANRFFGELSVLDKAVISATVVAETKLTLTILPLPVLLNLFQASPGLSKRFLKKIATGLAEKVRSTNAAVQPTRALNTSNAQNKWALARKVVNFSGMLMNIALQESAQMALSEENDADDSPVLKLARRFLALWSQGRAADMTKLVARDVIYLDPYAPEGRRGAHDVAKHLHALLDAHKEWRWQVMEFFAHKAKNKFSMRLRLLVPERRLRVWAMLMGAVKHDKFTQLELFFDRGALDPERPALRASASQSALSPRSPREGDEAAFVSSSFGSEKDFEFRQRFALKSFDASIIQEFDCQLSIAGLMDKHPGQLYVSQEVLCFGSRVFGLDMKKVIPLVSVDAIERADLRLTLVSKPAAAKEVTYVLVFNDLVQTESAHQIIGAVVSAAKSQAREDDADAPDANESYIERHLRVHQLHRAIKDVRLAMPKGDKAARVEGPRAVDTHSAYDDDVVGRAISNYPCKTALVDGKVVVDPNVREGDPICDQFVVDRFPNQTMFAVADGCNWGWKPRNAAFAASHRFVEFLASQQGALLSSQTAAKIVLQGFNHAHNKIVEGNESNWWEVGTTTMIGGVLLETPDPELPWALIAAGVGDCKAYHFHFTDKHEVVVDEITRGSRSGANITDAADPGGRLGPHIKGNPDLRNLACWMRALSEGDLVLVCSDGVHDNLDPQHLGKTPQEFGLGAGKWSECDAAAVEKAKQTFANNLLKRFLDELAQETGKSPREVPLKLLVDKVIGFCQTTCASSRKFLEEHPGAPQPTDYAKFPGKLDHVTCVVMRARKTDLRALEQRLDSLVVRMRHPISGLAQRTLKKGDTTSLYFAGKDLVAWLRAAEHGLDSDGAETLCQLLLNFRAIRPLGGFKSTIKDSFSVDANYEFQVYQPIMTQADWQNLLKIGVIQRFQKGSVIIQEGTKPDGVFQIVRGTCAVKIRKTAAAAPAPDDIALHRGATSVTLRDDKSPKKDERSSDDKEKEKAPSSGSGGVRLAADDAELITISHMGESEIFGEITYLEGRTASATVVASSDAVDVYVLTDQLLKILWVADPSLEGRFYHFLASTLARRLKSRENKL